MPSGSAYEMGCEKPSVRFSLLPWAWARYPTPTRVSFFWKPSFTPFTMFATLARIVPESALAAWLSSAAAKVTWLFSSFTTTSRVIGCVSVPSGPFTVTADSSTVICTLSGTATGYFAIRDMVGGSLDHHAEHFAADAGLARAPIGHHALGRGDDGHTEPVHDARD